MRQLKEFVISRAGTRPYWCLQNVRLGYGLNAKHGYALLDWQNTQQHKDKNFPNGLAIPVYWNWTGTVEGVRKNWGHIGVRLPDGRIWTDGKYFNSVDEVSSKYLSGSSYLGWGESVEGVKVIELGGTMSTYKNRNAQYWYDQYKYHLDGWKRAELKLTNQNKAIAEKDKILAQIKAEAETAQGKLKADVEAANEKILELTAKYEQAKEDLEEANKTDEKAVVEGWLKQNLTAIRRALIAVWSLFRSK